MSEIKNTSGIYPKGNKVLLRPESVETTSRAGIVIPIEVTEKEDMASMFGYCVALGPVCWPLEPAPRCVVGDYVIYAKYAGQPFTGNDGVKYRLVNASDIIATKDYDPEDRRFNRPTGMPSLKSEEGNQYA